MFKLMKYEFRKQASSKAIILVLTALLEAAYLIGIFFEKEKIMAVGVGGLMVLSIAALTYVSFECLITFKNDLKTKNSYMLFLTPNSAFKIMGAKVLTAGIQIILTGVAFLGLATADFSVAIIKLEGFNKLKEGVVILFKELFRIDLDFKMIVLVILSCLVSWLSFIILAFLATTLSVTVLSNSKLSGVLSVGIFIVIMTILMYVANNIIPRNITTNMQEILSIIVWSVFSIISYIGTSLMLDKKVSL